MTSVHRDAQKEKSCNCETVKSPVQKEEDLPDRSSYLLTKGRPPKKKRLFFYKSYKGGGGSFPFIKIYVADFV